MATTSQPAATERSPYLTHDDWLAWVLAIDPTAWLLFMDFYYYVG
jgi:hypothetical protein